MDLSWKIKIFYISYQFNSSSFIFVLNITMSMRLFVLTQKWIEQLCNFYLIKTIFFLNIVYNSNFNRWFSFILIKFNTNIFRNHWLIPKGLNVHISTSDSGCAKSWILQLFSICLTCLSYWFCYLILYCPFEFSTEIGIFYCFLMKLSHWFQRLSAFHPVNEWYK